MLTLRPTVRIVILLLRTHSQDFALSREAGLLCAAGCFIAPYEDLVTLGVVCQLP